MSAAAVFLPVFAQVALTLALLLGLAVLRVGAIRRRQVRVEEIALREPGWPLLATKVGNAVANQFELPVLFYVAVLLAWTSRGASLLFVVLSWLFVASRFVHAAIHTGPNIVPLRGAVFGVGVIVVAVLWLMLAAHLLAAPAQP